VGICPNFDVAERIVHIVETSHPNSTTQATYAHLHGLFNRAYHALEPLFDGLAKFQ
jgi:hypothetical protein